MVTYNFSRVKYGKHSEKYFASEKNGITKLSWSKIYNDFRIFCQQKNIKYPSRTTFVRYFQSEFNVGLKIPRSDQCNVCFNLEVQIKNEQDIKLKNDLKDDLKHHKKDASLVRDFVFWAFQKSYKQQGKPYRETDQLELYEDFL